MLRTGLISMVCMLLAWQPVALAAETALDSSPVLGPRKLAIEAVVEPDDSRNLGIMEMTQASGDGVFVSVRGLHKNGKLIKVTQVQVEDGNATIIAASVEGLPPQYRRRALDIVRFAASPRWNPDAPLPPVPPVDPKKLQTPPD